MKNAKKMAEIHEIQMLTSLPDYTNQIYHSGANNDQSAAVSLNIFTNATVV
jgi:hypothetical protein